MVLDDDIDHHWSMVFEYNNGWVDEKKELLHANMWDVYNSEKYELLKGGHLVEAAERDRKRGIWEVVDDHVVEGGG